MTSVFHVTFCRRVASLYQVTSRGNATFDVTRTDAVKQGRRKRWSCFPLDYRPEPLDARHTRGATHGHFSTDQILAAPQGGDVGTPPPVAGILPRGARFHSSRIPCFKLLYDIMIARGSR